MESLNEMIMYYYDELLEEANIVLVVLVPIQAWKQSVGGLTQSQGNGERHEWKV